MSYISLKIVIKGRKPLSLTLLANTGIFISGVNPKLKLSFVVICNGIRKNCVKEKNKQIELQQTISLCGN